jgi:hypothetical protein
VLTDIADFAGTTGAWPISVDDQWHDGFSIEIVYPDMKVSWDLAFELKTNEPGD